MILYLDTTERDSFVVALVSREGRIKRKKVKSECKHSEKLLRTISDLLNFSSKPHPSPPLSKGREQGAELVLRLLPLTKGEVGRGLQGIAVVKGPGSFTSLRIGVATANALAYALGVPVIGVKPDWPLVQVPDLFKRPLKQGIVLPEYGREPNITSYKF